MQEKKINFIYINEEKVPDVALSYFGFIIFFSILKLALSFEHFLVLASWDRIMVLIVDVNPSLEHPLFLIPDL